MDEMLATYTHTMAMIVMSSHSFNQIAKEHLKQSGNLHSKTNQNLSQNSDKLIHY